MSRHLSYANAVATLALFLALGGTGYAAIRLPRSSVGTAEIRDGSIRSRDIRDASLRSRDIRDGSLRRRDLATRLRTAPVHRRPKVLRAMVTRAGDLAGGEASTAARAGPGVYRVHFPSPVAGCAFAAALAAGVNSEAADIGAAGRITVESRYPARVALVRTYDAAGAASDEPFHLLVAC